MKLLSPTAMIAFPSAALIAILAASYFFTSSTIRKVDGYEYLPAVGEVIFKEGASDRTVVFIGSYTCSHCKDFYEGTFQEILENVDGKVVYRHVWPTSQTQRSAALLTACSGEDMQEAIIDAFYARQRELVKASSMDVLYDIAGIPESDIESIQSCAENLDKDMLADQDRDAKRFKISGTPTIVIDGEVFVGNHSLIDLGLHED